MEKKRLSYGLLSQYRGELMGLAMLWIMLYHAFQWKPGWPPLAHIKEIGFCGVDVFLLLSALGVAMSLSRRHEGYGTYLKRRLTRVLPLYFLVTGCYGLALRLAGRTTLKTVAWTVSTLFYWVDRPHCFNWYIPALVGFYLIAPLAVKLLGKFRWPGLMVAVSWMVCFVIYHIREARGIMENNGGTVMRLPVFLLGLLLGLFIVKKQPLKLWHGAIWLTLPLLTPLLTRLCTPYYIPTGFWFFLRVTPLCLGLSWLMSWLPAGGVRRVLREIGGSSLEIYLLNVIFVREYDLLAPLFPGVTAFYLVTMPCNILLGIGLHYAAKRPLTWLSGKMGL